MPSTENMSYTWLLVDVPRAVPQTCWLFSTDSEYLHADRDLQDGHGRVPGRSRLHCPAGVAADATIQDSDTVYELLPHPASLSHGAASNHAQLSPQPSDARAFPAHNHTSMVQALSSAPSWVRNLDDPFNVWGSRDRSHSAADPTSAAVPNAEEAVSPSCARVRRRKISAVDTSDTFSVCPVTPDVQQRAAMLDKPEDDITQPHVLSVNTNLSPRQTISTSPEFGRVAAERIAGHEYKMMTERPPPKLSTQYVMDADASCTVNVAPDPWVIQSARDQTHTEATTSVDSGPPSKSCAPVPCEYASVICESSQPPSDTSSAPCDWRMSCESSTTYVAQPTEGRPHMGSHSETPFGADIDARQAESIPRPMAPAVEGRNTETMKICPTLRPPLKGRLDELADKSSEGVPGFVPSVKERSPVPQALREAEHVKLPETVLRHRAAPLHSDGASGCDSVVLTPHAKV
ncbi:hypothetical protein C8T65DRAFT_748852 [Cerioporus squamosus]|nr:hypothetical protein C8T65DRAFT_748852 [Cerioporus squamosus]